MKILQINVTANWGSTGHITENISLLCMQEGWESYVAYGRYANPSKSCLIRIGNQLATYTHGLHSLAGGHGLGSAIATRCFIRQIEKIQPDIIHLHNIHGYYLNYPLLFHYLQQTAIPVVWTLHDCWPLTGQCAYFDLIHCNKWQTECKQCPNRKSYPRALFDCSTRNFRLKKTLFTSLNNLTLIPVSQWLRRLLQASFLKKYPIQTIHNGIDTDTFHPMDTDDIRKKLHAGDKFILLGSASIWNKRKGFDDLLLLHQRLDHTRFLLVLVGLTDKQLQHLPSGITGIKRTDSIKDLAALYSAAGIYLNPTYEDSFPTTNLEAMACGTPVCTYRTGGSPEAIDTHTGFVVEQGDIEGMKQAALTVWQTGKDHYRDACRNRAVTHFQATKQFAEYINLYKNIVAVKTLGSKNHPTHHAPKQSSI